MVSYDDPQENKGNDSIITADEAKRHLQFIKDAMNSDNPGRPLIEGFMKFGPRFATSLGYLKNLAQHAKNDNGYFIKLADQSNYTLTEWLTGKKMTDRADEDERRVIVAKSIIEIGGFDRLERLAALSILKLPEGHPLRDVSFAHQAFLRQLVRCRTDNDVDGQVIVIQSLLDTGLESVQKSLTLIEETSQILMQVSEPDIRRDFLVAAMGYYINLAINERDSGNKSKMKHWVDQAKKMLDKIKTESVQPSEGLSRDAAKNLLLVALAFDIDEKYQEGADTYALIVDSQSISNETGILAAKQEGKSRLILGQYQRAVKVLSPLVPIYEERYLTAVDNTSVLSAGEDFFQVVNNLAFSHAYLDQWEDALRNLEKTKSLRLRYQAALRQHPTGKQLLRLEKILYALSRGVPIEEKDFNVKKPSDWIGQKVSLESKVREEYRALRPRLAQNLLEPPSIKEVSENLSQDEAVVIMGMKFSKGIIAAVILAGDKDMPSASFLLRDWTGNQLIRIFAGDNKDGWLFALGAPEANIDHMKSLDRLLSGIDEKIGKKLALFLNSKSIRRITIIPHLWFHLVPFWAVQSLREFEIMVSPSATHFINSNKTVTLEGKKALAISDPTLDLPVSAVEVEYLGRHLSTKGMEIKTLARENATEENITKSILPGVSIVHFSGHGLIDATQPLRSSLVVHHDISRFTEKDPFQRLLTMVKDWHMNKSDDNEEEDDDERYANIPNLGRIYELRYSDSQLVERRFEYSERGTLWGHYYDEKLLRIGELWSAGDILVQESFESCKLVFLSACNAGDSGISTTVDEYSGLPAALQLAGVSTIVSTLWPAHQEVTAIYVDLLYKELAQSYGGYADISAIIKKVNERMRIMEKEEAKFLLNDIKNRVSDPILRFKLEATSNRLLNGLDFPFSHPYYWASFFPVGSRNILVQTGGGHP